MLWLLIILLAFIFQIATILILEFRYPSKTIAWLFIIYVLPFIGFVMYYFLAQEYRTRRKVRRRLALSEDMRLTAFRRSKLVHRASDMQAGEFLHQERFFKLLQNFTPSPITSCNKTEILTNGQATFDSILAALELAQHHIHLEYYTLRNDEIGCRFKEVMVRKARSGVHVRLIYDGLGSYELSKPYLEELREAGVETQCFLTPRIAFFKKRMNYRNHRKIVVIDGITGFVGGINIGDEYLGLDPKLGFWRDTHLRVEGDAVYFLQEVFMQDWRFTAKERLTDPAYLPQHHCEGTQQVQIVSSGPDSAAEAILECVFAAIAVAKSRIYITTPYFIPDESVLMGLRTAALSGIDVRIVIPQVADSNVVLHASLSYVEPLLGAGVRFYRYQKGFIHAKVILVDHLVASVGTANLDMRSFFSNFELSALLFDAKPMERLEADFMQDLLDSKEMKLSEFSRRPRMQKGKEILARLLSPLL